MALEDMTGTNKYLSTFNPAWPDGDTDPKQQGDDQIRGIKNVLLNTFGALAASVAAWMGKDAGGAKITNLAPGTVATDAATFAQAQAAWDLNARGGAIHNLLAGSVASDAATVAQAQTLWDQDANGSKITNLANGTLANDAVNRAQLDAVVAGLRPVGVLAWLRVTGSSGAVVAGSAGIACVRSAAGTYTVTLPGGAALAFALTTALGNRNGAATLTDATHVAVTVWQTGNGAGNNADGDFVLVVFG